jgi:hypothetical protein
MHWFTWYRLFPKFCQIFRISRDITDSDCDEGLVIWKFTFWQLGRFYDEECRLMMYKTPVCTSKETHYVSTTELSQLMLCKIWGFHSGNYEEYRLLRYKNPVGTSQETHYLTATETSLLMLCRIWGFHSGNYEECRLLGYKNPVRTSQETHYLTAT